MGIVQISLKKRKNTSKGVSMKQSTWRSLLVCASGVATAIPFANYSPLIPLLQHLLHIEQGQIGLLSTVFFAGVILTSVLGGYLVDQYGPRVVLMLALTMLAIGSLLFPLVPDFTWMLCWRFASGLGAGAAFVAGATMQKDRVVGQGLFGGSIILGTGVGIAATPILMNLLGDWRRGFLVYGLLSLLLVIAWLACAPAALKQGLSLHRPHAQFRLQGLSRLAQLGLVHMGTYGLGNVVVTWITVYFLVQFRYPLPLAAVLGSLSLLAGSILRPLGGFLLARWPHPTFLMRIATALTPAGILFLILPTPADTLPASILTFCGLSMLAIGMNLPYAAIFTTAARASRERGIGTGVGQGLIILFQAPALLLGGPLIGLFLETGQNSFPLAFGSVGVLFGGSALIASWLLNVHE